MSEKIKTYKELRVYNQAFETAMEIFHVTKAFPVEEKFALVDQIRRSSRSVCANIAEAWRKRRYKKAFILKLNDSETEACETQVWLQFARSCGYIDEELENRLDDRYSHITSQLFLMIRDVDKWTM
jgi:four helix bundle protein